MPEGDHPNSEHPGPERPAPASCADTHLAAVYEELRRRAREAMKHLPPGQTLEPTALVHEAYANLVTRGSGEWKDNQHFLACATLAMKTAIVDRVRARNRVKRGGGVARVPFDSEIPLAMPAATDETILKVDDLLTELQQLDSRAAEVVKYRFFVGMTEEQIGAFLGVSTRTIRRDWIFAKTWVMSRLSGDDRID